MLISNRGPILCVTAAALLAGHAWAEPEDKPKTPEAEPGVAAYIGDGTITIADLDARALRTNMTLAQSLFEARQAALDEIIMERLLTAEAASLGVAVDALIAQRISEKSEPVTDAHVEAFFNANRARMQGGLDAMKERIRQYLQSQRTTEARQDVLNELKKRSDVRIALEPPRVDVVVAANDPVQGPAGAKVTIVEYVDFQ
jgi:hypothetical protein